jgi:hypothetical protein
VGATDGTHGGKLPSLSLLEEAIIKKPAISAWPPWVGRGNLCGKRLRLITQHHPRQ